MVKLRAETLDRTFAALADPTRRAIVARMARTGGRGLSVSRLAEPFDMTLPAVSKHVRVLERAGLLRQYRDGRVRLCTFNPRPMRDAARFVNGYRRFWEHQLDALAEFLEQPRNAPKAGSK